MDLGDICSTDGGFELKKQTMACIWAGVDWTAYATLLSTGLGMAPMSPKHFRYLRGKMLLEVKVYMDEFLEKRRNELVQLLQDKNSPTDSDGCYWITVSFDGIWKKQGFSSRHGCVFAVSHMTNKIIDYEVLSTECSICANSSDKRKHQCKSNFDRTSSSMEKEGVKRIYGRSKGGLLKYAFYLGDGDSSSYASITNVYDGNPAVQKAECCLHVSKRVMARFNRLVAQNKKLGGLGGLSKRVMLAMQRYYRRAILDNANRDCDLMHLESDIEVDERIQRMKVACPRAFYHPCDNHDLCPEGSESWCFHQKWKVTGGDLSKIKKTHILATKVCLEDIEGVVKDLTDESLLRRCVLGMNQNANESMNSLVWNLCSKKKYHGTDAIKLAASLSVIRYNEGAGDYVKL